MSTGRKTQRANILARLVATHGAWVPLPEIMACAAQYNARISWFRLAESPAAPAPERCELKSVPGFPPKKSSGDWFQDATGRARPKQTEDLGPLFAGVER